jgi:hypothetical protein
MKKVYKYCWIRRYSIFSEEEYFSIKTFNSVKEAEDEIKSLTWGYPPCPRIEIVEYTESRRTLFQWEKPTELIDPADVK